MLQVDGSFYLYLAVMILCLPIRWVAAAVFAAAFHELCHLAAICLAGSTVQGIRIKAGGAEIRTQFPDHRKELLCAAAGPVGSLFLFSLYRVFPRIALCAGAQGIFNLLPLYPMDGGRISSCLFSILIPRHAEVLQRWTERILSLMLLTAIIVISLDFSFCYPLVLAGLFFLARKTPCKQRQIRVQ